MYQTFIDKKIGEKIVIKNKYSSKNVEYILENILPIEKYIYSQCLYMLEN